MSITHFVVLVFCMPIGYMTRAHKQRSPKVVLQGSYGYSFGVKVKTVKLIGGRIIQMMTFTQIMDI